MRKILALAFATLALAACSKSPPPSGRWEGTYAGGGTFVAARLEIEPDATVRVSAPDVTGPDLEPADRAQMEENMAERLAGAWGEIEPRRMDFDGTTFRKPGGIAPQIDWDAPSKTMTLYVYIGTQPALKIPLHAVPDFSDNPWPR